MAAPMDGVSPTEPVAARSGAAGAFFGEPRQGVWLDGARRMAVLCPRLRHSEQWKLLLRAPPEQGIGEAADSQWRQARWDVLQGWSLGHGDDTDPIPLAVHVCSCFRPLLQQLARRLVESGLHSLQSAPEGHGSPRAGQLQRHERTCIALSVILQLAPHTISSVEQYFASAPSPLERFVAHGGSSQRMSAVSAVDEGGLAPTETLALVRATYRLALCAPQLLNEHWLTITQALLPLLHHPLVDVRWTAIRLLSCRFSLGECAVRSLSNTVLGDKECAGPTSWDTVAGPSLELDCARRWEAVCEPLHASHALPFTQLECVETWEGSGGADGCARAASINDQIHSRPFVAVERIDTFSKHGGGSGSQFVSICDVELEVRQGSHASSSQGVGARPKPSVSGRALCHTPTTLANFEALVLGLCQRRPLLLEGPAGCGKSSLVEELARMTGNAGDIITIHLDDQLDSKTLLGAYACTEVPGEFVWRPGVLAQAATHGWWMVFENIDLAPSEVLTALLPLLEKRQLYLPGEGRFIQAANGFQLFATITLDDRSRTGASQHRPWLRLWSTVTIKEQTPEEWQQILSWTHPNLNALVEPTLHMFRQLHALAQSRQGSTIRFRRPLSLRELLKFATRIHHLGDSTGNGSITQAVKDQAYREALDSVVGMFEPCSGRDRIRECICTSWSIPPATAIMYEEVHKPSLSITSVRVAIGRVQLPRRLSLVDDAEDVNRLAHTGQMLRMLEQVAVAVKHKEPVLLVGETGCGKTAVVQQLATFVGAHLYVVNMSQQSDASDLLGGFKPVETQTLCLPLLGKFEELFCKTFPRDSNREFLERVHQYSRKRKWKMLFKAIRAAAEKLISQSEVGSKQASGHGGDNVDLTTSGESLVSDDRGRPEKRRKKAQYAMQQLSQQWSMLLQEVDKLEKAAEAARTTSFAFSFVEGVLLKALQEGSWILLDEINLAPPDTLERLSGLVESASSSINLVEKGDVENVARHPNFRLFGCMNPATDVGKRELAMAFRSRFTELFCVETTSPQDLQMIVQHCLRRLPKPPVEQVVDFYLASRKAADERLLDGTNQKPQYSLRTLTRALQYVDEATPTYGLQRALWDGFAMSFLTLLQDESRPAMEALLRKHLLQLPTHVDLEKTVLRAPVRLAFPANASHTHVDVENFWLEAGGGKMRRHLARPDDSFEADGYILTKTVRSRLRDLARAVLLRKYPILLQGPTSAGKTSMVKYLAEITGHKFVRINNHEHTDLQEYLGTYATESDGRLAFKEGALVDAVRNGHWLVLDELNLAPSDVLEALNRLLDDNRELFVPELQQVVHPHPHFMLFATQNPPGIYGGRKVLSRAFRNRFMELHLDDIPEDELKFIIEKRCSIAPSYCNKMVTVMKELQRRRQGSRTFAGKHGFITPRDLFRWAGRDAQGYQQLAEEGFFLLGERLRSDDEKEVVQQVIEKMMRVKVDPISLYNHETEDLDKIRKLTQGSTDSSAESSERQNYQGETFEATGVKGIVWTHSLKRLFHLVSRCMAKREPVLLVGETGSGKTTICQLFSLLLQRKLHVINCHQHSETSDFIGGFRPVRNRDSIRAHFDAKLSELVGLKCISENEELMLCISSLQACSSTSAPAIEALNQLQAKILRTDCIQLDDTAKATTNRILSDLLALEKRAGSLFEWHDGPLIDAMREGHLLLIDEISIAEDSVLERLNSVLEPERRLLLAEKGGGEGQCTGVEDLEAHENFYLFATMNPGGDFGKKELSPALRNRFTEIWVPSISSRGDLEAIVSDRLSDAALRPLAPPMLKFWHWFENHPARPTSHALSVRDLLTWASYIKRLSPDLGGAGALIHGAYTSLLDGIGVGTGVSDAVVRELRNDAQSRLLSLLLDDESGGTSTVAPGHSFMFDGSLEKLPASLEVLQGSSESLSDGTFGVPPFQIVRGPRTHPEQDAGVADFRLDTPTTTRNMLRVLRALQVDRAVLLEGSPGVGKSSIVAALARYSGHKLVRINLSEQSDMMDLLGTDLPTEGVEAGSFKWCDGSLLRAVKDGDWVLLDELNLAPQPILEGLNALLDHRGEVFLPELNQSFRCPKTFRLFATQNPITEGGGRKGLPKSFLNRFTKIYVDSYTDEDLVTIACKLYPEIPAEVASRMVAFNQAALREVCARKGFANEGAPWDFNLRDILRWCELSSSLSQLGERKQATSARRQTYAHAGCEEIVSRPPTLIWRAALHALPVIYIRRLRSHDDRLQMCLCAIDSFGVDELSNSLQIDPSSDRVAMLVAKLLQDGPVLRVGPQSVRCGWAVATRCSTLDGYNAISARSLTSDISPRYLHTMAFSLEALLHCIGHNWLGILTGAAASGKTQLVRYAAGILGFKLEEYVLTSATDATEIIGCFEQADGHRRLRSIELALHSISSRIGACLLSCNDATELEANETLISRVSDAWCEYEARQQRQAYEVGAASSSSESAFSTRLEGLVWVASSLSEVASCRMLSQELQALDEQASRLASERVRGDKGAGHFEWVDGVLSSAMQRGHWILLENANLCNPTVLDRLNAVLEPNGTLLVNERGQKGGKPLAIKPHPDFRLFLTVDPSHGELSRAMRNRGVEIFVESTIASTRIHPDVGMEFQSFAWHSLVRREASGLLSSLGVPGALALPMADMHQQVSAIAGSSGVALTFRELLQWARLMLELVNRGHSLAQALLRSWKFTYLHQAKVGPLSSEYSNCLARLFDFLPSSPEHPAGTSMLGGHVRALVDRNDPFPKLISADMQTLAHPLGWPRPTLSLAALARDSVRSTLEWEVSVAQSIYVQTTSVGLDAEPWSEDKQPWFNAAAVHRTPLVLCRKALCGWAVTHSPDRHARPDIFAEQVLFHACLLYLKQSTAEDVAVRMVQLLELVGKESGDTPEGRPPSSSARTVVTQLVTSFKRYLSHPSTRKLIAITDNTARTSFSSGPNAGMLLLGLPDTKYITAGMVSVASVDLGGAWGSVSPLKHSPLEYETALRSSCALAAFTAPQQEMQHLKPFNGPDEGYATHLIGDVGMAPYHKSISWSSLSGEEQALLANSVPPLVRVLVPFHRSMDAFLSSVLDLDHIVWDGKLAELFSRTVLWKARLFEVCTVQMNHFTHRAAADAAAPHVSKRAWDWARFVEAFSFTWRKVCRQLLSLSSTVNDRLLEQERSEHISGTQAAHVVGCLESLRLYVGRVEDILAGISPTWWPLLWKHAGHPSPRMRLETVEAETLIMSVCNALLSATPHPWLKAPGDEIKASLAAQKLLALKADMESHDPENPILTHLQRFETVILKEIPLTEELRLHRPTFVCSVDAALRETIVNGLSILRCMVESESATELEIKELTSALLQQILDSVEQFYDHMIEECRTRNVLAHSFTAGSAMNIGDGQTELLGGEQGLSTIMGLAKQWSFPKHFLCSVTCQVFQAQLLPLRDHAFLTRFQFLLEKLMSRCLSLVDGSTNKKSRPLAQGEMTSSGIKEIQGECKILLTIGLSMPGCSLVDLLPLKQLHWALSMVSDQLDACSLSASAAPDDALSGASIERLKAIMHDVCYCFQCSTLANSLHSPAFILSRSKSHLHPSDDEETHVAMDMKPEGLAVFERAHRMLAVAALCCDPVRVSEVEPKLLQLKIAAKVLLLSASSSWDRNDVRLSNYRTLKYLVRQLIRAHRKSFGDNWGEVSNLVDKFLKDGDGNGCSENVLEQIKNQLGTSNHPTFRYVGSSLLVPLLHSLALYDTSAQQTSPSDSSRGDRSESNAAVRGLCWLLLGIARFNLVLPTSALDPNSKHVQRLEHVLDQLQALNAEEEVLESYGKIGRCDSLRSRMHLLSRRRAELDKERVKCEGKLVPRPPWHERVWKDLCDQLNAFGRDFLSVENALMLYSVFKGLVRYESHATNSMHTQASFREVLARVEVLQDTASRLMGDLETKYWHYLDIVQPVQLGLLEVKNGLTLLSHVAQTRGKGNKTVHTVSRSLLSFPVDPTDVGRAKELIQHVFSPMLDSRHSHKDDPPNTSSTAPVEERVLITRVEAMRAAIHRAHLLSHSGISRRDVAVLWEGLCNALVKIWQQFKAEADAQQNEAAQLFSSKARSHSIETDEEREEKQFRLMFPDLSHDFADLAVDPGEDDHVDLNDEKEGGGEPVEKSTAARLAPRLKTILESGELVHDLVSFHRRVFSSPIGKRSCPVDAQPEAGLHIDEYRGAFDAARRAVRRLHSDDGWHLPPELDACLCDSQVLIMSLEHDQLRKGQPQPWRQRSAGVEVADDGKKTERPKGRKKVTEGIVMTSECHPEELAAIGPILVPVQRRIEELLSEFPDNALLLQLEAVCSRIQAISTEAPIMKALLGLELLLSKAQTWEESAAEYVSLRSELQPVSALVLRWRRAELASWRHVLAASRSKCSESAGKWWFHLYSVILLPLQESAVATKGYEAHGVSRSQQPVERDEQMNNYFDELGEALESFLHVSPLGEFSARLDLISGFVRQLRLHVIVHGKSVGTAKAEAYWFLRNFVSYFRQFEAPIEDQITSSTQAIEEELQNFVKLAKWEDRNFYAMKASAEKAHRTLHRLVLKYEGVLKQPVTLVLKQVSEALGLSTTGPEVQQPRKLAKGLATAPTQTQHDSQGVAQLDLSGSMRYDSVSWERLLQLVAGAPAGQAITTLLAGTAPPFQPTEDLRKLLFSSGLSGDSVALKSNYVLRIRSLSNRMLGHIQHLICGDVQWECGWKTAQKLEDLTETIIHRSMDLKSGSVPKARKKAALSDLLKALLAMKLRRRAASFQQDPSGRARFRTLLHTASPQVANDIEGLPDSCLSWEIPMMDNIVSVIDRCFSKSEEYFFRNAKSMQGLLEASADFNKELTLREVEQGVAAVEELLELQSVHRNALTTAAQELTCLKYLMHLLSQLTVASCRLDDTDQVASSATICAQNPQDFVNLCVALGGIQSVAQQLRLLWKGTMAIALDDDGPTVSDIVEKRLEPLLAAVDHAYADLAMSLHVPDALGDQLQVALESRIPIVTPLMMQHALAASQALNTLQGTLTDLIQDSDEIGTSEPLKGRIPGLSRLRDVVAKAIRCADLIPGHPSTGEDCLRKGFDSQGSEARFGEELNGIVKHTLISVQNLLSTARPVFEGEARQPGSDPLFSNDRPEDSVDGENGDMSVEDVKRVDSFLRESVQNLGVSTLVRKVFALLDNARILAGKGTLSATAQELLQAEELAKQRIHYIKSLQPLLLLQYVTLQMLLCDYSRFHRAVSKLCYVLANLFTSLCKEGFCTPGRNSTESGEGGQFKDDVEGTGMGEGEGKRDVSDQITDEDQLGRDEPRDDDDGAVKQDDEKVPKGIEMERDFEGSMHDLEDDDLEKQDEHSEDDNDALPNEMGDIGEDENQEVVDEQMWNEEDERTKPEEETLEDGKAVDAGQQEREYRGKDDEEAAETRAPKDEPEQENPPSGPEDPETEDGEDIGTDVNEMTNEKEPSHGMQPEEKEELELPDDTILDGSASEDDADDQSDLGGDAENESPADPEPAHEEDMDGQPQRPVPDDDAMKANIEEDVEEMDIDEPPETGPDNGTETDMHDADSPQHRGEELSEVQEQEDEEGEDEAAVERAGAAAENESQDRQEDAAMPTVSLDDVVPPEASREKFPEAPGVEARKQQNAGQSHRHDGQSKESKAVEDGDRQEHEQGDGEGVQGMQQASEGAWQPDGTAMTSMEGQVKNQDNMRTESNPYRHLGNAAREWFEKLHVVQDADERMDPSGERDAKGDEEDTEADQQENVIEDTPDASKAYQFSNDELNGQTQTLGAADRSQQDRLQDLAAGAEPLDGDGPSTERPGADSEERQRHTDPAQEDRTQSEAMAKGSGPKTEERDSSAEKKSSLAADPALRAKDKETVDGAAVGLHEADLVDAFKMKAQVDDDQQTMGPDLDDASFLLQFTEDELQQQRLALKMEMMKNPADCDQQRVWSQLEALTSGPSRVLAEQLRLILEPTLATKLQGDYRTGKRINMKKVIGYIASQFRKDKIWMRRTKPNKRRYQVILAIDDSRSMSESGCGPVALEALTTICKAMSLLEVGEMGVVSFGEMGKVKLLHELEQPFSTESGARLVAGFTFQQDNKINDEPVLELLQYLHAVMESAAHRLDGANDKNDLQQLVIILADGRFHEKEKLRRCIRNAFGAHQMLAFVVLDSSRNSVLDMQSVTFSGGAPTFRSYMDSFPFPFYTVVQDVASLPRTLSDLMRQWFELSLASTYNS